jgi:HTH-type transcriptional regulator / antitoxin HipB
MDKTTKTQTLEIPTRAPNQLGQAISRFRARKNLSQASLAKSAGVRQATVHKVEKGLRVNIETVYAVCAALELELVIRPRNSKAEPFHPEDVF